eukprot:g10875.t1
MTSSPVASGGEKEFPVLGLLPKQETEAWDFVQKFPEYDGRGVKVAIFDTGVDPAASGLQVCPDGSPKVLDIVDCTGSGDVDTTTVIKPDAITTVEGIREIKGLSGRTLRLNPKWASSSGEWRVGLKRAYELFPKTLETRVKEERRKDWDKKHLAAEAAVARELAAWRTAHPAPNPSEKKFLQDLEARAAHLEECKANLDDPGPLHDCVVWKGNGGDVGVEGHSGEELWWCAVDVNEDGDLTQAVAMTDFDKLRQHGRFSDVACLNFGVHIYDGGDVLSIVVDAGAHGTHVAGIVAAYYPDDPEANGVAPGAQIVSLKIGDSRLGSMETGTGVVRAVTEAVRMGCDVINMSYGEAAALCDSGRVSDVVRDAAFKHGILFFGSAMNAGPALSTVQAPGGSTQGLIGVGAYASPSLMSASFSMRETLDGSNFTWTSAGPTADGDIGVSVMAPGGAISPVPNWTLQKKQLMMGTSMASPNCAGVVSLLLSGMKQKFPGKKLSVHRVRRALENTAKRLPGLETLVQGQGLVQVSAAFEYLSQHAEDENEDVQYKVTVSNGLRGVYLRQPSDVSKKTQWAVTVKPVLHEDDHNDKRTEFEMRLRLSCDGDWVECSADLALLHSGRAFVIAVDPTRLAPGLHYTSIEGYDVAAPGKGPMFRVPLTALIPTRPEYVTVPKGGLTAQLVGAQDGGSGYGPGKVVRRFVHPPHGASWMDVEVKDCREVANAPDGTRRMMVLHCQQLLPHTPHRDAECHKYMNMNPGQKEVHSMRLEPCAAVEVSLAQNWSAIGPTSAEVTVTFRGVSPSPDSIKLHGGSSHAQVIVSAPLVMQELAPSASLNKWCTLVAPSKGTISALGERDVAPDGRQSFALLLEYSFKQPEVGEVTPRLAALNGYLYESAYEAQMCMIFDSNKKLLAVNDCWPEAKKLSKGEHTVRVQVRHPDQSALKRLKAHPLMLIRKLSTSLPVPVHATMMGVSTAAKPPSALCLEKGHSTAYFFAEPNQEKLPKGVKPGDLFTGTAYYVRDKANGGGDGKRPGGYPISYIAGPAKIPEPTQDSSTPSPTGAAQKGVAAKEGDSAPAAPVTDLDKMLDALRDLRVKHLENCKAKSAEEFQKLYTTAKEQIRADGRTDPDTYLPLLLARLHFLDREGVRRGGGGEGGDEDKENEKTAGASTSGEAEGAAAEAAPTATTAAGGAGGSAEDGGTADGTGEDTGVVLTALRAVVAAADDVVNTIDQGEVAKQLGTNVDTEDVGMVSARKEFDDKKKALADAFARKARALAEVEDILGESETTKATSPFLAAYSDLIRWADVGEDKHAKVSLAFLRRKNRLGMMVKLLTKLINSSSKAVSKEEATTDRAKVFQDLGWDHLVEGDKKWALLGHPKSFTLF